MLKLVIQALILYVQLSCTQRESERCVDSYTNTVGRCRKVVDCKTARDDFQLNGIQPTFCTPTEEDPVVCCREGASILHSANNRSPQSTEAPTRLNQGASSPQNDGRRVSLRKCQEYSRGVTQNIDYISLLPIPQVMTVSIAKCEYDNTALILGGQDAELGEFPHMAALGWPRAGGGIAVKCGGSLISPSFVLTAGHCLKVGRDPSVTSTEPTVVWLGEHNINNDVYDGADPIEVPIRRLIAHPGYRSPWRYNDIALVEMASSVNFSASIRPACLWSRFELGNSKAVATGWGIVNTMTNRASDILQKVSLDLMENDFCDPLLKKLWNRHWSGFNRTQLCAGVLSGGKDSCQGDSGGPLQVVSKENQCIFHIIGVTSFGGACAAINQPAVYTRVSEYIDWLESIVWPQE